jgi:hypothetical protein
MSIFGAYAHGLTQVSIFIACKVQFLCSFAAGHPEIPTWTAPDELKGKGALPGNFRGTKRHAMRRMGILVCIGSGNRRPQLLFSQFCFA